MSRNFSYDSDHISSSRFLKFQSQPEINVFFHHKVSYHWINFSIVCTNILYQTHSWGDEGYKVTGDDEVPGDALKTLEENGLRIVSQLTNHIHETGELPKDFTEIIVVTFK
jgi:hypothetical protein